MQMSESSEPTKCQQPTCGSNQKSQNSLHLSLSSLSAESLAIPKLAATTSTKQVKHIRFLNLIRLYHLTSV